MTTAHTIAMPISSFLPNLGGAEVGLHNIASRLAKRGRKPVVMAPAPHVASLRSLGWQLPYGIEALPPKIWSVLHRMPWLGFRILDLYFARMQARYRFDFWHCTMGYPTGVALVHFAQKRNDIRYLVRCAGEDIQRDPELGYGARLDDGVDHTVRSLLPLAPNLIAISESVADEYRAIGANDDQIHHIPNGVDLGRFARSTDRRAVRLRHGLNPDAVVFLSVGRNHPKKNYAKLVEAASRLKANSASDGSPFEIVLVGNQVAEFRRQVRDLGLEDQVKLIDQIGATGQAGGVPDLPAPALVDLYLAADVFVFPSLMETFGIAIVEAMAAGLPIIAGDSPGCRDVVRKGRDGMLVDPRDSVAIADAMSMLMLDGDKRRSYARKAKARAKDFGWDQVVGRYAALYDDACA